MKWLKRIGLVLLILLIGGGIFIGRFVYQAKVGFERYETAAHDITIPPDRPAVLVISKTTGFRHEDAIVASGPMFQKMATNKNWFIYQTEDAGIFNEDQLNQFDVVVFNNATGTVLNSDQQSLFKKWLESEKGFNIICAEFSHHPIENQFQEMQLNLLSPPDSTWSLTPSWSHNDEWYIFKNHPADKGANIVYEFDGNKLDPNGNILWVKGFEKGMGAHHPVAWWKDIGQGRAFYTSIGHTGASFSTAEFVDLVEQAIKWTGRM